MGGILVLLMASTTSTRVERVRIPREIWVLVASAFVIALGFGLITPVLPQFAQSFGVGATASAIVVSVFAFFRLVFAPETLLGQEVLAVVNFPPRQIGKFISEVLVLGVPDENGAVVLVQPSLEVPVGGRLH